MADKLTKAQDAFLRRIARREHINYTTIKGSGDARVAKALEAKGLVKVDHGLFATMTAEGWSAVDG